MKTKIPFTYLFLIIAPLLSSNREPLVTESENFSPSFVSSALVANEKYVIDKKESVVTWIGSMVLGDDGNDVG